MPSSSTKVTKKHASQLIIIGASGHGRVVADCAELTGYYDRICFLDSGFPEKTNNLSWPVIDKDNHWHSYLNNSHFIVAIGDNKARLAITETLLTHQATLATLIHPSAIVSQYSQIGQGSVVLANAVINAGCQLGIASIINTGASVDHDCQLADGCHIAPGAHLSGNITLGKRSWVGVGCSIIQQIVIGDDTMIGAGATVISNLTGNTTYIGTPAKPLSSRN